MLIFDEVVTGFRAHPRGIQGLFGIDADLACYGKVVGGGFPIGVIAGKRPFMDALDGGHWEYGDDSTPTVGVTYFAGTFVRHPLALAAAKASLQQLRDAGPVLQESLNSRTADMVAAVNASMLRTGRALQARAPSPRCGATYSPEDLPYGDLLYVMLRQRGIHILDNFPCFLTTAHSDADIARIVDGVPGGGRGDDRQRLLPRGSGLRPRSRPKYRAPALCLPPNSSAKSGSPTGWEPRRRSPTTNPFPCTCAARWTSMPCALRSARCSARHDALRSTLSGDGLSLHVHASMPAPDLDLHDFSGNTPDAAEAGLAALVDQHVSQPFDLSHGPLVRTALVRLQESHHVFVLTGHHIVLDGWSFWVLVKELAAEYARITRGTGALLPEAPSFADYALLAARGGGARQRRSRLVGRGNTPTAARCLSCPPTGRVRACARRRAGRYDHLLPAATVAAMRKMGAKRGTSLFASLLAGFSTLLYRLTHQDDVVIGIPRGRAGRRRRRPGRPLRQHAAAAAAHATRDAVRAAAGRPAASRCSMPTTTSASLSARCCRRCRCRATPPACRWSA